MDPWEQRKAALVGFLCGAGLFLLLRLFDGRFPEETDRFRDVLNFVLSVGLCMAVACAVTAVRNVVIMRSENRDYIERRRGGAPKPRR